MTAKTPRFDQDFLDRQRRQLSRLREQLKSSAQSGADEEAGLNSASAAEAREYEDDAQKLALLETEGNVASRVDERLARVERALRKLDEGTYGYSDVSGKPIPEARLEATPEAINTVEEQAASDP
jgi:DnaK suppressor protein